MTVWAKRVGIAAVVLALLAVNEMSEAQTALSGVWVVTEATLAGEPDRALVGHRLLVEAGHFQITKNDQRLFGGRFETDSQSSPPTITFHQTETPTLNGIWRGIFELDGDSLTVCDNAYDMTQPRPKTFDDCSAPGYVTLRFARVT